MPIILSSPTAMLELPVGERFATEMVRRALLRSNEIGPEALGDLLANRILGELLRAPAHNGRPPTDAQLKYALDLATKYGVSIPAEAFSSRMAIGAFISALSSGGIPPR